MQKKSKQKLNLPEIIEEIKFIIHKLIKVMAKKKINSQTHKKRLKS